MIRVYYKEDIQLTVCKNIGEISEIAVDEFKKIHNDHFSRFYIVPGGSTPVIFYSKLASRVQDWNNTKLLLSDERWVDEKSDYSNIRMVRENLIDQIKTKQKPTLISFHSDKFNIQNSNFSLTKIAKELSRNGYPCLCILGMGSDGHTAGLFPGNKDIINKNKEEFIFTQKKDELFPRISLTYNYLMKSNRLMFLISGEEKSSALRDCLEGRYDPVKYPIQYILFNYEKPIHIICDKSAASELSRITDN